VPSPPPGTGVYYQSAMAERRRPARGAHASVMKQRSGGSAWAAWLLIWPTRPRLREKWAENGVAGPTIPFFLSFLFQISDIQIKFEFLFKFFRFQLSIYNSKVKVNPISIIIYSSTYYLIINGLIRIPFLIFYFIFSFMS
jgi:hypothetical protein